MSQTVNGATTSYTLDLNAGLTQVLSDHTTTYLYGLSRIAQYNPTDGSQYFLGDLLGSVRQLTDEDNVILLSRSYQPYGEILAGSGEGRTVFGFTGEAVDETGLQYLRARYYDPITGRFQAKDPWEGNSIQPQTYNKYVYALGNPIAYRDPSGQMCIAGFDIGTLGDPCTEQSRQQAAAAFQTAGNLLTPSVNFLQGYVYEVIDGVLIIGPETARMVLNSVVDRHPVLRSSIQTLALLEALTCGNRAPLQVLDTYRNGYYGGSEFEAGRAWGRAALILAAGTQVTVGIGGGILSIAGEPFTLGASTIGVAASVSISASGAAVLAGVAIKETNDHLIYNMVSGKGENGNRIKNTYPGKRSTPNWPSNFISKKLVKVNINNEKVLTQLREIEKGKWQKVYEDGWIDGKVVSIHWFESPSGRVFDLHVVWGNWSN